MSRDDGMALYDERGGRKYLSRGEARRFLDAAGKADAQTGALCRLLAFSGCRVSEALGTSRARLDQEMGRVVFRTLKRRRCVFRAVPIPDVLMTELVALTAGCDADERIWTWCRQTAWRRVKAVMAAAEIAGAQASPKGLRHGFGVANAEHNIPANLTRRWMGHARLETTAIYQNAVDAEERSFAERLW